MNEKNTSFASLERELGYRFKNKQLLKRALTHSSASQRENYEQLEFLGDAVIQLVVTSHLYGEGGSEGEMTMRRQKLVSHAPLKCASEELDLPSFIVKGVADVGEKALSSVYEAVCEKFVNRTLLAAHVSAPRNFKGELQEYVQGKGQKLPEYSTRRTGGTENKPEFSSEVSVCGRTFFGEGKSKSEAERLAAKSALDGLKKG